MRIRPEAQAILDRSLPDRLDSLWCEVLASPYGSSLLEAWDLNLEQVRVAAPVLECRFPDILRRASRHSYVNSMICAAEWVAEDLLTGRRDWQGPPLAYFTAGDVEYNEVDIRDVFALAFDEGLEEAQERHYLQVARDVWPVMDRILEFSARPIASFSGIYHPTSRDGPIDAAQLASACLRERELSAWMESLGICPWRLHNNLLESGLRTQVSLEKLRWMYRQTSVNFLDGKVHGVLGRRLEVDGLEDSLELGSPWESAERILGALRLWSSRAGPVWALISGDKVRMLTLSLDDGRQDSPPE